MTEMLRVGNCSGFYGDRLSAMREMLEGGELDVLTGDWLAELTMLILARDRAKDESTGYAKTFLTQLRDCLGLALDRGVTIVANAGGVNTPGLVAAIRALAAEQGLSPTVAHVRGDDLTPRADELDLGTPLGAHAYLGGFGIARAVASGADVVVTGRVTDASVIVGPAIARFGWGRDDLDALAGATVAGHVIECGTQATGGNYAFFTEVADLVHPGFPIAEILPDGSSVITKHPGTAGAVTVGTVTSQLLYEVQDARYAGPDVTTRLDSISLRQDGTDRVSITGVRGEAPPPDVKVSLTSLGGFRNEMTMALTGLDIEAKSDLVQRQFHDALTTSPAELTWTLARTDTADPATQQQAAALLTVVARDPDTAVVGRPFSNAAIEIALGSYPGWHTLAPPAAATPYGVFTPGHVPQSAPRHEVVLDDGSVEQIEPPTVTRPLEPLTDPHTSQEPKQLHGQHPHTSQEPKQLHGQHPHTSQEPKQLHGQHPHTSQEPKQLHGQHPHTSQEPKQLHEHGPHTSQEPKQLRREWEGATVRAPLGRVAGARSGDKGGNANIGVWVREDAAWPWLSELLTTERVRELLPEAADLPITLTRLPNLRAVNIVIEGLLGEGVAYNARFDPQAKGLGEWLRARHVDIPQSLIPTEDR
ncbi:acyclic terpene utilization AtuA family protein [Janibacter sp. DB-40]|uniref:acyclic terpene utilization AtuA family protein n=1 Tax=Janibacter sp. DB-40 TaxID=3028808 RepID=UPI002406E7F7|nr:acyclic terpene utilization AtuA family protein [Janibacter sp. DB-40]